MRMSEEQYKQLLNTSLKYKQSKYHNKKIIQDGIKFDSKLENKRYNELKMLEKAKIITDLKLQPKYELQPKFNRKGE